ncbi:MAG: hypothetical protein OXP12_04555 [Thaumarchaeota archaeon]|nr:hypothetical protein [Nitrososphaerota archaeon]MDE0265497.1 hypothetical protein [Nitrososphaerota archaeon]MDE0525730.1 hypothetical protein [Nitrososphaerota archaeon]
MEEIGTRRGHRSSAITEYHNRRYSGMRGKCVHCMVIFRWGGN